MTSTDATPSAVDIYNGLSRLKGATVDRPIDPTFRKAVDAAYASTLTPGTEAWCQHAIDVYARLSVIRLKGPRSAHYRMAQRPRAVLYARLDALTPAQAEARRFGYELTAGEAEFFVTTEHYARLLFLEDRDALPEREDREPRGKRTAVDRMRTTARRRQRDVTPIVPF